jgi:hypothetical protein
MRNFIKYAVAAALMAAPLTAPSVAFAQSGTQSANAARMNSDSDSYRRYIRNKRLKALGIITALSALVFTIAIVDGDNDNDPAPVSP